MYDPQALSTNYSYCSHYLAVLVGAIAKEEIAYKNLRSESINTHHQRLFSDFSFSFFYK